MSSTSLIDNFGRPITYMRLAVTDRCNLRCFYCMPEEGIKLMPKKELLTYEEMERLANIACDAGIRKIRITGGEPFVRKGMIDFLERLSAIPKLEELHITTNGIFTNEYIDTLKRINISSVNLSLDTLDSDRFFQITRRNGLNKVMDTLHGLMDSNIPVKINMVVMNDKNTQDIVPMAELARKYPISVRYIEEMPFNGDKDHEVSLHWNHTKILDTLKSAYPEIIKQQDPKYSTAYHYSIPGFQGNVGIIAAYSRTFCGSCNRIRVTAQGQLKTCLYDHGSTDLKQLLRSDIDDADIGKALAQAISKRHKDGWEAERQSWKDGVHESMSTIGG